MLSRAMKQKAANRLNELLAAKARAEKEKQWAWDDQARIYQERDLLLGILSKVAELLHEFGGQEKQWDAHLTRNTKNRKIVLCVHTPAGQLAWTIHSASQSLRDATAHLPITDNDWDGANTAARVERLRELALGKVKIL